MTLQVLEQRWPRAWGVVVGSGLIRQQAGDFFVEEIPLATPRGDGEHLWLWVEKTSANTAWVAGQLARSAGISGRAVSFAGRKDRHARTRQYFSLHMPGTADPAWQQWQIEGVTILSGSRHLKKLRRGALEGNRFRLIVRDITATPEQLDPLLETIRAGGVPNYFGPQRFGRNGANIARAELLLTAGKRFSRDLKNILVSAARSLIFNEVLAARVIDGTWNQLIAGDTVQLAGSQSRFVVDEPDRELLQRCADFDITPTGPLPGDANETDPERAVTENTVLHQHAAWVEALRNMRVAADRRPLRLVANHLRWSYGENSLQLDFELSAGTYATALLREILDCEDSSAGS